MITDKKFLNEIVMRMNAVCGMDYQIEVKSIDKNNGIVRTGLSIQKLGEQLSPLIYLEEFYEQYRNGMSVDQMIPILHKLYEDNKIEPEICNITALKDYNQVKSMLVVKLINSKENEQMLRDTPYVEVNDLAAVVYVVLRQETEGQMLVLIHNAELRYWGVDKETLYADALASAPIVAPEVFEGMQDVMRRIVANGAVENPEYMEDAYKEDVGIYVLSNKTGIYGAGTILYPGVLKRIAEQLRSDLILIPSSVHEILVAKLEATTDFDSLREMVKSVNYMEVSPEERLSDNVYVYHHDADKIEIAK
jgi:hypothetical protein